MTKLYTKLSDTYSVHDGSFSGYSVLGGGISGIGLLADQPTGFWPFDDPVSSTTIADRSGNANNGTPTSITFNSQYGAFNGTTSQASMGNPAAFYFKDKWSLEAWVRPSAQPYNSGIVAASDFSYELGFGIHEPGTNTSKLWVGFNDGTTTYYAQTTGDLPGGELNTWMHIAGVRDGNVLYLYKNGDLVASFVIPGAYFGGGLELPFVIPFTLGTGVATGSAPTLYVGRRHNTGEGSVKPFFPGDIALVSAYNKALSESQIDNHYQSGLALIFTGAAPASFSTQKHYNIRSFDNTPRLVTQTVADLTVRTVQTISGSKINTLGSRRAVEGQTNEDWVSEVGNLTVGRDSSNRYRNRVRLTVPNTQTTAQAVSFYQDNLLVDFNDPSNTYNIDIVLNTSALASLDRAASYIEFTSDDDFLASKTNKIFLNQMNIVTVSTTYHLAQFNRNLITSAELSSIRKIRFKLVTSAAVGADTHYDFLAMRLVESGYSYQEIEIDTKSQTLTKSIPQFGTPEWATNFPPFVFSETKPKNVTQFLHFNAGNNPTAPAKNYISLMLRYDGTLGIFNEVRISADSSTCLIEAVEDGASVYSQNISVLTTGAEYFLVVALEESSLRLKLYESNLLSLTDVDKILDSGVIQLVQTPRRGYVGLTFWPYNYNFQIHSILNQSAEFARFVSQPLPSFTPIKGAVVYTEASEPVDVLEDINFAPVQWTAYKTQEFRVKA